MNVRQQLHLLAVAHLMKKEMPNLTVGIAFFTVAHRLNGDFLDRHSGHYVIDYAENWEKGFYKRLCCCVHLKLLLLFNHQTHT